VIERALADATPAPARDDPAPARLLLRPRASPPRRGRPRDRL